MHRTRLTYTLILVVLGAGWGITQPLSKIAVSEGYRHIGIVFWQMTLGAAILGAITLARGRRLPLTPPALRVYVIIALLGTLLPNSASYEAARHLPSGWLSVVISTAALATFPIALALGLDRFSWPRLAGLLAGVAGVACLVLPFGAAGSPAQGGLAPDLLPWLLLALLAPCLYALEGNYVAKWGLAGLDPVQALFGASLVGACLAAPVAVATGTFIDPRGPWGAPDLAIMATAFIPALVYSTYVWLVGRAGSVFAARVSYLVTGFGVVWAMLLLGERYGVGFWAAVALMFLALALVQPRPTAAGPRTA